MNNIYEKTTLKINVSDFVQKTIKNYQKRGQKWETKILKIGNIETTKSESYITPAKNLLVKR